MTEQEAIKILTLGNPERRAMPYLAPVYDVAIKALEEVQQYRALGTVEELKEAKEKQIAKKPIWNTSDFINRHHCAICDGIIYAEQQYCDNCGQKLDWGNEDAE